MFKENNKFEKFESKVWLSSPTMHGPEIEYVKEAYETNWMSTVGKNINEVERLACEYIGCKYAVALSAGTASLHLAMKLAGIEAYGMPKVGHGALEGKKVFCSDMTFDATEDIKKNNDYAMWLKVCRKADCYLLDEILGQYRKGRVGSVSTHSIRTMIGWHYKLYREAEDMGILSSLFNTGRNLVFGFYKKKRYVRRQ